MLVLGYALRRICGRRRVSLANRLHTRSLMSWSIPRAGARRPQDMTKCLSRVYMGGQVCSPASQERVALTYGTAWAETLSLAEARAVAEKQNNTREALVHEPPEQWRVLCLVCARGVGGCRGVLGFGRVVAVAGTSPSSSPTLLLFLPPPTVAGGHDSLRLSASTSTITFHAENTQHPQTSGGPTSCESAFGRSLPFQLEARTEGQG